MGRKYKDDSTRGASVINPRNYKSDSVVQVWLDRRKLATLLNWLESDGARIKFMSEIVKLTIDIVIENLTENGIVKMVEHTVDADYLLNRFGVNLNPNGKGLKNKMHNLVLSNKRDERFNSCKQDDINIAPNEERLARETRDKIDEMMRVYQELENKGKVDQDAIKSAIESHQEGESGLNNLINQKRPCEIEEPFHSSHHPEIKEAVYKELSSRSITESIVDVDRNQLLAKLADDKLKDMP